MESVSKVEVDLDSTGIEIELKKAFRDGDTSHLGTMADALRSIADGVGGGGAPSPCPTGMGFTATVIEGLMGVAAGLVRVSDSLESIADAIRETNR